MSFIKIEDIYRATNDGLDIITDLFPEAKKCVDKKQKFKLRPDEKTPSASLYKKDGRWMVTDFGGDGRAMSPADLFCMVNNMEFSEAVKHLAHKYQVKGENQTTPLYKPKYEKRKATAKEKEGEYYFKIKPAFTNKELSTLGSYVTENACNMYNWYSLESYTTIKNRESHTFISTPDYPIYLIDYGEFKKLYKPFEEKKEFRFFWIDPEKKKPADFIGGMEQIQKEIARLKKSGMLAKESIEESENNSAEAQESNNNPRVDKIFICAGEKDALNCASLGKWPVWFNSETAHIKYEQIHTLLRLCWELYNIPDIDKTGREAAKNLALRFLKIKTVWLPSELQDKKDWRGNPCKDLTDFLNHYEERKFSYLVQSAKSLEYWEVKETTNKKTDVKTIKYDINNVRLYEFLQANGYFRYVTEATQEGYFYIHVNNGIVEKIPVQKSGWKKIRAYIINYLEKFHFDERLINFMHRTDQLKEASLSDIDELVPDFTHAGTDYQYLFFRNKAIKIIPGEIQEYKTNDISTYCWKDKVVDHDFKKVEPFFKIENKGAGHLEIEFSDSDFSFYRFLRNTSRVHWRQQDIEMKPLTEAQANEEALHFINKCYCIGYMLHRYKNPSRPWAVFAIDAKESEIGRSEGGSGKSLLFKSLEYFIKQFYINGRNLKNLDDPFIFDGIDDTYDYILIDDANRQLEIGLFFTTITGPLHVNPKNHQKFIIPFEKSPKMAITSNHAPRNIDGSTERRLLYTAFSDYYSKERSPYTEFGKLFFSEYTEEEWNQFYNFMAQCLSFYLQFEKIDPPMENIEKRILREEMGELFLEWASDYFDDLKLNDYLRKEEVMNHFMAHAGTTKRNPARFKKQLQAWCTYNGCELNPAQCINTKDGRIVHKKEGKSVEMIYIKAGNLPIPVADSNNESSFEQTKLSIN